MKPDLTTAIHSTIQDDAESAKAALRASVRDAIADELLRINPNALSAINSISKETAPGGSDTSD